MHGRHGGHRQEIMNSSTAVGKHFSSCGLENMQIQIIDSVKEGEIMALLNLKATGRIFLQLLLKMGTLILGMN